MKLLYHIDIELSSVLQLPEPCNHIWDMELYLPTIEQIDIYYSWGIGVIGCNTVTVQSIRLLYGTYWLCYLHCRNTRTIRCRRHDNWICLRNWRCREWGNWIRTAYRTWRKRRSTDRYNSRNGEGSRRCSLLLNLCNLFCNFVHFFCRVTHFVNLQIYPFSISLWSNKEVNIRG